MGRPIGRTSAAALAILLAMGLYSDTWWLFQGVEGYTQEQIGTYPIRVMGPKRTPNGGIVGMVPIGYIGTSIHRNGHYYLPKGYQQRRLPVLIMLHGSNMDGLDYVTRYRSLADKYRFIIIAPDSHRSLYWYSPATAAKPFTEDFYHVIACYRYVRKLRNVLFDYNRIAMGGNSRGGYSAFSLATRTSLASHAVVTHSRFLAEQTGTRVLPVWVSTGSSDSLFSPRSMTKYIADFKKAQPKFRNKITFRVFPGGHSAGHADELEATIRWWYATRGTTASKY